MEFVNACRLLLSDSDKASLNQILEEWEADGLEGEIIVSNLKYEQFLQQDSWQVLFKEVSLAYSVASKSNPISWVKFKNILRNTCQEMQLLGGVTPYKPVLVGTVLPLNRFENYLWEHCPRFRDEDAFAYFYLHYKRSNYLPEDMLEFFVNDAEYLLWLTWGDNEGESPFYFATHKGHENRNILRTGLGLGDPKYQRHPLVTFVFNHCHSDESCEILHQPTFCDAELCVFFFPGNNMQGITNPLNGGKVIIDGVEYNILSRPEAVQRGRQYPLQSLDTLTFHF